MVKTNKTIRKVAKNIKQTETIGKDKRSEQSKEVEVEQNSSQPKQIEEVEEPTKREPQTREKAKSPKEGSMLACILEKFPSEGEYSMEEVLALIREGNTEMQNKKDSSLRTVVKELVKEKGKASPHINRYAFLTFDEASKKYQRV